MVDGGALAQQIPNQANQVKFSFDPAGNITYSPFLFSAPTTKVGGAGADQLASGSGADAGTFRFDTRLPGNGNGGHDYGTMLADEDKRDLLEYLKTQ